MGEKRKWKTGDRIYRFGFDPNRPNGYLDVFELTDVSNERVAKYRSVKNADATIGSSSYLSLSLIGSVYSCGRARYVVLGEYNYWKARKLLAGQLTKRREDLQRTLSKLNEFENWLSGQNEDNLE